MKTAASRRIVLIHALSLSIAPIRQAFVQYWPEAELVNLLDDSLSVDLKRAQAISTDIIHRIAALGSYAASIRADAILFTCSAFGKAIDALKQNMDIPVLKPNEAMFEEALHTGGKTGMLVTFEPSVSSMEAEFKQRAAELNSNAQLTTILVSGAMDLLNEGDSAGHNRLLQQAAAEHFKDFDQIMLAQFSNAQAHAAISEVFDKRILTSPGSSIRRLQHDLDTGKTG